MSLPQVNYAVVHVGDRVGPPRRRVARQGVDGAVARRACPALELLPRVLHPSQAALVVGTSFGDVCTLRARQSIGRGAWVACRILLQCR